MFFKNHYFGLMVLGFVLASLNGVFAKDKLPKMEVVFVIDTTGSMSDLIAAAKNKIWSIANTMALAEPSPMIKIGLVGFRDRKDQYITKEFELSADLDAVYKELMGYSAFGGGDKPESVNQALNEAVTKIKWDASQDTYKVIFLVGDAPPHMDYQDDIKYLKSCQLAIKKGIIINTIQCGNFPGTDKFWIEIAEKGNGSYFRIAQTGGTTVYDSPYDHEINEISEALDNSRIYYGEEKDLMEGERRQKLSKTINEKAESSSLASRACFNNSISGEANSLGAKELISDIEKSIVKLEDISENQLPEEIKSIKKEKRAERIETMIKERKGLREKLLLLTGKRQVFIQSLVAKKSGDKDSFDSKIFESIQPQSKQKKIYIKEKKY
jgi:hypothetical protein